MLTSRQAFKVGFLRKCANAGLTIEETRAVVKQALATVKSGGLTDMATKPLEVATDLGGSAMKTLGNLGVAGLMLAPPVAGGALGYLASRLTDIDDTDVAAVKQKEIIDEYRRQAANLRRKRELRGIAV